MNLDAMATVLDDAGVATTGQDLFIFHMPDDVDAGVMLRPPMTGTPIDPELPGYSRTGFQAIVRHTDYAQGMTLAKQVSQVLTLENASLPGMSVRYVRPKHEPIPYPSSKGDYLEFSVNFEAVYVNTM